MKSQPGKQTIARHILPNISRGKCNQTMIERNMEKHTQNVVEKLFLDSFLKNQN